ncbi:KTSC domain-containing protein [Cupriavidus basilensis]
MDTTTLLAVALTPVESSQIHSIGHDAESGTLAVRFKNKAGEPTSLYHYRNVTAEDFAAFSGAESIGSHFYKHIKPFAEKYPYERIEAKPAEDQAV